MIVMMLVAVIYEVVLVTGVIVVVVIKSNHNNHRFSEWIVWQTNRIYRGNHMGLPLGPVCPHKKGLPGLTECPGVFQEESGANH